MNRSLFVAGMALLASHGLTNPVHALDFSFDNGVDIALDTTVTYGAQWRVESRDSLISADQFLADLQEDPFLPLTDPRYVSQQALIINGDDGNNNFDTGLVSNRVTVLMDMDARWRDYGLFVRGRAFYDTVYKDDATDLDANGFRTYNSGTLYGGPAGIGEFPPDTRDEHGDRLEFLDAFVYGTFELPGDRLMDLRAGRQVVNWGEATFIQGVNILNPIDVSAFRRPGAEIKEGLLPVGMLYANMGMGGGWSLEGFYQYEWEPTVLDGCGTYFSDQDYVATGCNQLIAPEVFHPLLQQWLPDFAMQLSLIHI